MQVWRSGRVVGNRSKGCWFAPSLCSLLFRGHRALNVNLRILECFTLYLRNRQSGNLRALENCICGLRSIERNMRSFLRTVQDRSTYFPAAEKADRSWEYITPHPSTYSTMFYVRAGHRGSMPCTKRKRRRVGLAVRFRAGFRFERAEEITQLCHLHLLPCTPLPLPPLTPRHSPPPIPLLKQFSFSYSC
jgi:hypothetical protein